ncbi:MAG: lipase secretion chaperone, partial [Candidatus Binatia bacterium]
STLPLRLGRDETALRAAGGSPQEIAALREQTVGAAAAARLAELDQRRAAWDQRVEAYRHERAAIDAASPDRQQAVEALRARHLSGAELRRIDALDRLQASAPAAAD